MNLRITCGEEEEELLPVSQVPAGTCCEHQNCLKIQWDEVIFTASCMTTLIVLQLPMTNASSKPVPLFVFGNVPPAFHAFLVCLTGACFGSVCSIHIRKTNPKIASFYYAFSVLSMSASLAIAFSCFVWESFKALCQLC